MTAINPVEEIEIHSMVHNCNCHFVFITISKHRTVENSLKSIPILIVFSLKFSTSYYGFCLQLLTYGRRIPFAELFARIDAVDASTIKRVANRFFYDRVKKLQFCPFDIVLAGKINK